MRVTPAGSWCTAVVLAACGAQAPSPTPSPQSGGAPAEAEPTAGDGQDPASPPATPSAPLDPAPTAADPSGASTEAAALLAAHNEVRARHCAAPLAWSPEVAASAQKWADHLRDAGCAFGHSDTRYGENLAAGTSGSLSAGDVVTMWYREISDYDFRRGTFDGKTGHFTQVVWRGSARLGCGRSTCRGLDVWVCQYDPPGNVVGAFDRNVQPTGCSK
jgi:pathogenesis-related protein 1